MNEINQENEKNKINLNIQEEIPNLDILVKSKIISSLTAEKVKIFKSVIENKYLKLSEREKTKKQIWNKIEKYLSKNTSLTDIEKDEIRILAQLRENQIYNKRNKFNNSMYYTYMWLFFNLGDWKFSSLFNIIQKTL